MTSMKKTKEKKPKGIYIKADLIKRLIQFYLLPELQKKEFKKIQLIFRPEEAKPEILFDDQAKEVLFETKLKEGIPKKEEGEDVYLDEITGEVRKVIIKGEADSLHATFKKTEANRWLLVTDFLFNREYIKRLVTVSQEFLNSAETNFTKNQWHPFIDNLFSAYELLMKVYLVSLPYIESPREIRPLVKRKIFHKRITSEASKLRYAGLISEDRFKVLTKLKEFRWSARYLQNNLTITETEAIKFLDGTSDFLEFIKKIIGS